MGTETTILYRYERDYDALNRIREFGDSDDPAYEITLKAFTVKRHTPKGYWIKTWEYGKEKFILRGSDGKRYAYTTQERALENFIRRTKRALEYNKHNVKNATGFLACAESMLVEA